MITEKDVIYEEVFNHLKGRFDNDADFTNELVELLHFYGRKFLERISNERHRDYVETELENIVKSQYFQGYYMMTSILKDESVPFSNDIWNLKPGMIRNQIPIVMDSLFEDQENWYVTEITQKIGMRLIQMFDDAFELVAQMRRDIALYGAYKAFIEDSRYQNRHKDSDTLEQLAWGDPLDLTFINPQVYMSPQYITDNHEIWDIFTWSSLKNSDSWVGSSQLSLISNNGEKRRYLLQVALSESIAEYERYDIFQTLLDKLPNEVKEGLLVRFLHTKEIEFAVFTQDDNG